MNYGTHEDYAFALEDADEVVLTWSQLKRAVADTDPGAVIFIPGHAHLQAPEAAQLTIRERTLASAGGIIEQMESDDGDFIRAVDTNVHGITFRSQTTQRIDWPGYGNGFIARGITADGETTITNSRFRGWGHAGVAVGRHNDSSEVTIRSCEFVDNPMGGLGYGVETSAWVRISKSYFNNCRHSVAATGNETSAWSVVQCKQGPRSRLHAFDTHRPTFRKVVFRGNVSEYEGTTLRLRGTPQEGAEIKHNWIRNPSLSDPGSEGDAIRCEGESFESIGAKVQSNWFGEESPVDTFDV